MATNTAAMDYILTSTLAQLDFLSSPAVGILSPSEISHIQARLRSSLSSVQVHATSQQLVPVYPSNVTLPSISNLSLQSNTSFPAPSQYNQSPPVGNVVPGLPPRTMPPSPLYPTGVEEKRAVALWDYAGDQTDDLKLVKGDIVVITDEPNPQWLKGHLLTQPNITGLFPTNYVERIPLQTSPFQPPYQTNYQAPAPSSVGPVGYPAEKASQQYIPSGPQPSYQTQPPPPPHQPYNQQQGQGQGQVQPHQNQGQVGQPVQSQAGPVDQGKKNKLFNGDFKSTLAHSAVGGFGFGAGSSVAGHIVNAIL